MDYNRLLKTGIIESVLAAYRRFTPILVVFARRVGLFGSAGLARIRAAAGALRLPRTHVIRPVERSARQVELSSTITCPECGHARVETMPTDACQWYYDCRGCGTLLRPKPGDCCVFCSYGTVPCPPIQMDGGAVEHGALRSL
jgi:hypothetical protein